MNQYHCIVRQKQTERFFLCEMNLAWFPQTTSSLSASGFVDAFWNCAEASHNSIDGREILDHDKNPQRHGLQVDPPFFPEFHTSFLGSIDS